MVDREESNVDEVADVRAVGVSNYLFRAPNPLMAYLAYPLLALALVFIHYGKASVPSVLYVTAVLVIATGVLHLLAMIRRASYLRRHVLLVAIAALLNIVVSAILAVFMDRGYAFLVGAGFSTSVIFPVYSATADERLPVAATAALSYPILLASAGMLALEPVKVAMVLAFAIASSWLFMHTVRRPFRKNFDADGVPLVWSSLKHFATGGEEGGEEVEQFFGTIGTDSEYTVDTLLYADDNGIRAAISLPSLHPGPYGRLGGGGMPYSIAGTTEAPHAVCHSGSTHDNNPVSRSEVSRIVKEVSSAIGRWKSAPASTPVYPLFVRDGRWSAVFFGTEKNLYCGFTRSPEPTDDVDAPLAAMIGDVLSSKDRDVRFVDCHNSLKKGAGSIYFGTTAAVELMAFARTARRRLDTHKFRRAAVGAATTTLDASDVGRNGITALVFVDGDKKTALVFFDGNNMVPGLREYLLDNLERAGYAGEVFTSDAHEVNIIMGGYMPVGMVTPRENILDAVLKTVKEAESNAAEAMGVHVLSSGKVKVFGPGTSRALTAAVNSTISVMKPSYAAATTLYFLTSLWLLL